MTDKLKPCPNPWCPPDNRLIITWNLYGKCVVCTCGVEGPISETNIRAVLREPDERDRLSELAEAEAIAAWNTRVEPQWQPVETAPKDGTEFMAWWGDFEPRARFCQETERYEFFGWINYDQDGWSDEYVDGPTHWMPIPTLLKEE